MSLKFYPQFDNFPEKVASMGYQLQAADSSSSSHKPFDVFFLVRRIRQNSDGEDGFVSSHPSSKRRKGERGDALVNREDEDYYQRLLKELPDVVLLLIPRRRSTSFQDNQNQIRRSQAVIKYLYNADDCFYKDSLIFVSIASGDNLETYLGYNNGRSTTSFCCALFRVETKPPRGDPPEIVPSREFWRTCNQSKPSYSKKAIYAAATIKEVCSMALLFRRADVKASRSQQNGVFLEDFLFLKNEAYGVVPRVIPLYDASPQQDHKYSLHNVLKVVLLIAEHACRGTRNETSMQLPDAPPPSLSRLFVNNVAIPILASIKEFCAETIEDDARRPCATAPTTSRDDDKLQLIRQAADEVLTESYRFV